MKEMKFQAGIRSLLGSPDNHNTLEIMNDNAGNIVLVIQEQADTGKMRSQGVRIERPSGDSHQTETYKLFVSLIAHIHEMHEKEPRHPAYVVVKE